MTMKPKLPLLVLAMAASPLCASAVHASEPFRWEVGGDYLAREVDLAVPVFDGNGGLIDVIEQDFNVDLLALGAQWFLAPVRTDRGPLERAAFLDRASSLSATYVRSDVDGDFGEDANAVGIGGRFQFDSDWFVAGGFVSSDGDAIGTDVEATVLEASVGRYFGESTTLSLAVTREEVEFSGLDFDFDDDFTFYELDLEHVGDLGLGWQFAVDASIIVPEGEFDEAGLGLAVTLYPNRNLGFGLDLTSEIEDASDRPQGYSVFGRWFVNEAWSVSARYEWIDQNGSLLGVDRDDRAYGVGIRYRF